ncbi:hypothetical protein [Spiroplasma eriocheiris]|uniref:Transmembrane protein n=1 Tax=Spiroplasma eriocheiris TaxID=315358 RepID=A0A0H3XMB6_9MOLU|nr:hypothetical protein [Spiroplasma eriocheiris]AHF58314.1 hypothetical protein SPE_1202 [Spiroplasma eriocheiris CCTCC M 207170]AKM54749.1 hypothetical protein SERIO_v1c12000 [Spiroplasma eriocheiris]
MNFFNEKTVFINEVVNTIFKSSFFWLLFIFILVMHSYTIFYNIRYSFKKTKKNNLMQFFLSLALGGIIIYSFNLLLIYILAIYHPSLMFWVNLILGLIFLTTAIVVYKYHNIGAEFYKLFSIIFMIILSVTLFKLFIYFTKTTMTLKIIMITCGILIGTGLIYLLMLRVNNNAMLTLVKKFMGWFFVIRFLTLCNIYITTSDQNLQFKDFLQDFFLESIIELFAIFTFFIYQKKQETKESEEVLDQESLLFKIKHNNLKYNTWLKNTDTFINGYRQVLIN